MKEGSVVTFYSYKGGVGRTLVLASVAALLAMWGYRVLCVDWDLEAPGLHLYFLPWIKHNSAGLTELIQSYADGEDPNWRSFLTPIKFPDIEEPIHFISAGVQDNSYVHRMQLLDWKTLYEAQDLGNFLETLRQDWKKEYDFVLLDSRTGITDIGGICTIQLPDLLVLLFTANQQSLNGAIEVAERAMQVRDTMPFDRAKLLTLPIASRFEGRIEYELAQDWLEIFAQQLAPLYESWIHKRVTVTDLLNFTKVPYVPYWSFGEKIPVLEETTRDPESIGFALETIAALIAHRLSSSDVLVRNRDSFVGKVTRSSRDVVTIDQFLLEHGISDNDFVLEGEQPFKVILD